jgi:hypothetical protein
MRQRRDHIYTKWRREEDAEAAERSQMAELFPYPRPRSFALPRNPESTATAPAATESEPPDDGVPTFERPPVVLPENPSQWLRDKLAVPVVERLLGRRRAPDDRRNLGPTLSAAAWQEFMLRQTRLAHEKRRRDGECRHRPPARTADGPVFAKLFEDSLTDRNATPPAPDDGEAPQTFGSVSRRIVAEKGEMPEFLDRAQADMTARMKRRARDSRSIRGIRSIGLSNESRRICDSKDPPLPPFLQREHRDWDFKDVIEEYRNSEARERDRRSYYERLDE